MSKNLSRIYSCIWQGLLFIERLELLSPLEATVAAEWRLLHVFRKDGLSIREAELRLPTCRAAPANRSLN